MVFQSGSFTGYYWNNDQWSEPHDLTLSFHPEGKYVVHGKGKDSIGAFVATGNYSPKTLKMTLSKKYRNKLETA
ncbi:unnamed protein product, partial [Rotaria magnacalcarata]